MIKKKSLCVLLSIIFLNFFGFIDNSYAFDSGINESYNIEESFEVSKEENINNIENSNDIEMLAPTYQLSEYSLIKIQGYASNEVNGYNKRKITEQFDSNLQKYDYDTNFKTDYYYDRNYDIIITMYQYGYGLTTSYINHPDYKMSSYGSIYDTVLDSYNGVKAFKQDYVIRNIDEGVSNIKLTLKGNSNISPIKNFERVINIKLMDNRSEAPTTPKIIVNPSNIEEYLLTGVDNTMEYRLRNNSDKGVWGEWIDCDSNGVQIQVSSSSKIYQVRYKATETTEESKVKEFIVSTRGSAPSNVNIDWNTETIENLDTNMEISFDNESYKRVTEDMIKSSVTNYIDEITGSEPLKIKIRYAATEQKVPSNVKEIDIYQRDEEPKGIILNPNTYVVSGTTTSMQYLVENEEKWTSVAKSTVDLSKYASDKPVTVKFRTKKSSNKSPSKSVLISLPALSEAPSNLKLNYSDETVSGFSQDKQYQYRTTSTGSWSKVSIKDNVFSISTLIPSSGEKLLQIRIAPTENTQISQSWKVTLSARPVVSDECKLIYNDVSHAGKAVLVGADSNLEYKIDSEENWKVCPNTDLVFDLPSTSTKKLYIRVKTTDNSFSSKQKTLTIYSNSTTTPSVSLNTSTESITVNSKMEYKEENGEYKPVPDDVKSINLTDVIDKLSGSESKTYTFRYMATETRPCSKEKILTLVARREAPKSIVYSVDTKTISGASSNMQYREVGKTTWKTASSKPFSVASIVGDRTDVVLEFRFSPTSTLVGSYIEKVNCF